MPATAHYAVMMALNARATRLLKHHWFPWAGRFVMLAFLIVLTLAVLLGPSDPRLNVATVMSWVAWWPLLAISYLAVGRVWCAVCPMGALSELAHRTVGLNLKAPKLLKRRYLVATILFFAILYQAWIEEVARATVSPLVTGFILWGFTTGALVSGLIFERWTWCRHLCPLGAWSGVFAMASAVEVRADQRVCLDKKCSGIYCYFGRDGQSGCPFHQVPKIMDSNRYCSVCGNCLKACPNDAITVRLRLPGREFLSQRREVMENALIAVVALGVVGFQAFVMTEPWTRFREGLGTNGVLADDSLLFGGAILAFVAVSVGLFVLASKVFSLITRTACSSEMCRFGLAFLPLALAVHIGHNLGHLFNGYRLIPQAIASLVGVGIAATGSWVPAEPGPTVEIALWQAVELGLVVLGLGIVLWLVVGMCRLRTINCPWPVLAAPYAVLAVIYALAFIALFSLPMGTRL